MESDTDARMRELRGKSWDDLREAGISDMRDAPIEDEEVDKLIQKINSLKDYEGAMRFHGLKALLDEANYEANEAIKAVHEKVGSDKDLADYFRTVYPIPILGYYMAMFGNPNIYIVQRQYVDEVDCKSPTEVLKVLKTYKEQTNIQDKFIKAVGEPPKPVKPKPSKPKGDRRFARNIEEAKYSGILLDSIEIY